MTKSSTRKTAARKPIIQAPTLRKLNDAQRIVLSSAAQREDSAAALPASMTERAAQKLGAVLVEKGARPRNPREGRNASLAAQRGGTRLRLDHHQAREASDQR